MTKRILNMDNNSDKGSSKGLSGTILGVVSLAAGLSFVFKSLLIGLGILAVCVCIGLIVKYKHSK